MCETSDCRNEQNAMKQTIEVNNIRVYAYHGCLEEEALIGQNYSIDIAIRVDFLEAALSDDITKTVSYVDLNAIAYEEMSIRAKLIETVGLRILNRIKTLNNSIEAIRVKVIKHCPPINGDVENTAIILEDGNWT
jgi:dihydroneopterin aldolase